MSKQNVAVVESFLPDGVDLAQALHGDDPLAPFTSTPAEQFHPGFKVVFEASPSGALPLEFQGFEGFVEGWRDWLIPWVSYVIHTEEVIDAGDKVVLHVAVKARTERHGVEVEHRPSSVWTFRDGKIASVHFFLDRDDALRFAGVDT